MKLKPGQTIYAINECRLIRDNRPTLTIGEPYIIDWSNSKEFSITDDEKGPHSFDIYDFDEYFTTKPPKKERYFIVFFETEKDCGTLSLISESYPNRKETKNFIRESEKAIYVGITDIQELNQQDYESWNK